MTHHYSMTITDTPLGHLCQQTTCHKTAQAHVTISLDMGEDHPYDVCWTHARDLMLAPVDVLELGAS